MNETKPQPQADTTPGSRRVEAWRRVAVVAAFVALAFTVVVGFLLFRGAVDRRTGLSLVLAGLSVFPPAVLAALTLRRSDWAEAFHLAAVRSAYVAAIFTLVVCSLLLWDFSSRLVKDPLDSAEFLQLRADLAATPINDAEYETLQNRLRAMDEALREEYFRQKRFAWTGTWLVLGGVVVLLAAVKAATVLRRKMPAPAAAAPPADLETSQMLATRWAVAGFCVLLVGGAFMLRSTVRTELASLTPTRSEGLSSGAVSPLPTGRPDSPPESDYPPSADALAANWPRFRGPQGLGVAPAMDLPTAWDAASGEGILWKTPVAMPGNSSPVVWGDRLFLTGADEQRRVVLCYDTADGQLLWETEVPGTEQSTAEVPEVSEDTGFAAPTAATDGLRVYAIFANGDVGAVDFEGKLVWSKSLGIPDNAYGHASSLAMWRDRLIIQFDQAAPKDGKSRLIALDGPTGEEVWSVPREVGNSWPSPIVIHHEGSDQVITCSDPLVTAYNPEDGSEIWRCKCLKMDVGPSPAYADGVLYVANEYPHMTAIRLGGRGDITDNSEYVLWIAEDNLPDTCSPLATAEHVYVLASYGYLTCYGAKSGELLWEWESDDTYTSSPTLVGDLIYVFGLETCSVIRPGAEGAETAGTGNLGEECVTSPAFCQGRMFLRGKEHLFCLAKP